jgi:hypothetical protein
VGAATAAEKPQALKGRDFRVFSVQVLTKLCRAPSLNRFLIQGWEATKIRLNRKQ